MIPTGGSLLVLLALGFLLATASIIAIVGLVRGLIRVLAKMVGKFDRMKWRTDDVS